MNTLAALKLDTVALIGALFLETLNAIPVDAIVGIPAPHDLEVDRNGLSWLSVSEVDLALVLKNANDVAV